MTPELWSAFVGILVPIIINFVKPKEWSDPAKFAVAAICSVLAGLGTAWFAGDFVWAWQGALDDVVVVFTAATASYKLFWKPVFGW